MLASLIVLSTLMGTALGFVIADAMLRSKLQFHTTIVEMRIAALEQDIQYCLNKLKQISVEVEQ